MTFHSILFKDFEPGPGSSDLPHAAFLVDLQLHQIIDAITAGREQYDLKPFFYTPLTSVNAIAYRHQILLDLENGALLEAVESFAQTIRQMREQLALATKLHYKYQRAALFLGAAGIYCTAVDSLLSDLTAVDVGSGGFVSFRTFLSAYVASEFFAALQAAAKKLTANLAEVRYCFRIKGGKVTVARYLSEQDYSADVQRTFKRFQQGTAKDHRAKTSVYLQMDHVEAMVLDRVAQLFPDVFAALDQFCRRYHAFVDTTIERFDREVQFYLAYLAHMRTLGDAGLHFCYPEVSGTSKEVRARGTFDLALADGLVRKKAPVVCNDFFLNDPERIFIVSGPNQGGKTTFARTFGQLHYLASLGCPVPGTEVKLFLPDRILTHFEREENLEDLRGKLTDDLVRIHEILGQATSSSIVILNEIFTSTTLTDAIYLCRKVMGQIVDRDLLCVCVTFIGELASLSETTVSMVSTVVPENPAVRTFRVERRPANGMAYAMVLADKYGLTYTKLKARIGS